jgi:hypothetical protein
VAEKQHRHGPTHAPSLKWLKTESQIEVECLLKRWTIRLTSISDWSCRTEHDVTSKPQAPCCNSNKFLSRLTRYNFSLLIQGGVMKQLDYARLAEDCSKQADAMKPGPARDALIAKAKQYRSYAKMENWIGSQELQPPAN